MGPALYNGRALFFFCFPLYTRVMFRQSLVLLLGLGVFFTPFLGLPTDWKDYLIIGMGVILIVVGYSLRRGAYLKRSEMTADDEAEQSPQSIPTDYLD